MKKETVFDIDHDRIMNVSWQEMVFLLQEIYNTETHYPTAGVLNDINFIELAPVIVFNYTDEIFGAKWKPIRSYVGEPHIVRLSDKMITIDNLLRGGTSGYKVMYLGYVL